MELGFFILKPWNCCQKKLIHTSEGNKVLLGRIWVKTALQMEISLFEVDPSLIPTPLISVTLRERGLGGFVHGRIGSCSGSCPQKVPITWLWVSLLLPGALGNGCLEWRGSCGPAWELSVPDQLWARGSVHVNTEPIPGTSNQITGPSPTFKDIWSLKEIDQTCKFELRLIIHLQPEGEGEKKSH